MSNMCLTFQPNRLALKTHMINEPLQHSLMLADVENFETLFDANNLSIKWAGQAAVEKIHSLLNILFSEDMRRVARTHRDALDISNVAQINHV
jgi:hypothetical protein